MKIYLQHACDTQVTTWLEIGTITLLVCPRFTRKTEGGRTFTARSPIELNSIDMGIRKKSSVASFKYNLYKSYLDKQKATKTMSL
jgi:hypothetical protein